MPRVAGLPHPSHAGRRLLTSTCGLACGFAARDTAATRVFLSSACVVRRGCGCVLLLSCSLPTRSGPRALPASRGASSASARRILWTHNGISVGEKHVLDPQWDLAAVAPCARRHRLHHRQAPPYVKAGAERRMTPAKSTISLSAARALCAWRIRRNILPPHHLHLRHHRHLLHARRHRRHRRLRRLPGHQAQYGQRSH